MAVIRLAALCIGRKIFSWQVYRCGIRKVLALTVLLTLCFSLALTLSLILTIPAHIYTRLITAFIATTPLTTPLSALTARCFLPGVCRHSTRGCCHGSPVGRCNVLLGSICCWALLCWALAAFRAITAPRAWALRPAAVSRLTRLAWWARFALVLAFDVLLAALFTAHVATYVTALLATYFPKQLTACFPTRLTACFTSTRIRAAFTALVAPGIRASLAATFWPIATIGPLIASPAAPAPITACAFSPAIAARVTFGFTPGIAFAVVFFYFSSRCSSWRCRCLRAAQ